MAVGGLFSHFTIRENVHAVHDPDGHGFAAFGTTAVVLVRGFRAPADAAFSMAVVMVLSLLGEKLDRTAKCILVSAFQRFEDGGIREFRVKHVGLPRQFRR